jgi:hypothetical protein
MLTLHAGHIRAACQPADRRPGRGRGSLQLPRPLTPAAAASGRETSSPAPRYTVTFANPLNLQNNLLSDHNCQHYHDYRSLFWVFRSMIAGG